MHHINRGSSNSPNFAEDISTRLQTYTEKRLSLTTSSSAEVKAETNSNSSSYLGRAITSITPYLHHYLQRFHSALTGQDHQVHLPDIAQRTTSVSSTNPELSDEESEPEDFDEIIIDTKNFGNQYWKKRNRRFEFAPSVKAVNHCGIVYRGDSRSPDIIFNEGFKLKDSPDILSEDDFFAKLLKARLITISTDQSEALVIAQETAVCTSKDRDVASYFPSDYNGSRATFVYCCYINTGIPAYKTVGDLDELFIRTNPMISAKEVLTPMIPAEHILCAWTVKRVLLSKKYCYEFIPEYSNYCENPNTDYCVQEYLKDNPHELDTSKKIVKVCGLMDIEIKPA